MVSILSRLSDASATSLMFFGRKRTVRFSGVEESDAAFDGRTNQRDHLLLVCRRTVTKAHSHAAKPESRNFQVTISKFSLLHRFSSVTCSVLLCGCSLRLCGFA